MIWWLPWAASTVSWLVAYGALRALTGYSEVIAGGMSSGAALVVCGAAIVAVNLYVN